MSSADAPRSRLPIYALLAALAGLAFGVYALLRPAAPVNAFDLNAAMNAAGGLVPPQVDSFYFFVPETGRAHDDEVAELAELLARAARERDYLGIAGADAERNRLELLAALEKNASTKLEGLTLVYLGPEEHRQPIEAAVAGSGAALKFVTYPALPVNSI